MRLVDESGLDAFGAGVPAGSRSRQPVTPVCRAELAVKDLAQALAATAATRPRATGTGR
jgi:hypothetical protein